MLCCCYHCFVLLLLLVVIIVCCCYCLLFLSISFLLSSSYHSPIPLCRLDGWLVLVSVVGAVWGPVSCWASAGEEVVGSSDQSHSQHVRHVPSLRVHLHCRHRVGQQHCCSSGQWPACSPGKGGSLYDKCTCIYMEHASRQYMHLGFFTNICTV